MIMYLNNVGTYLQSSWRYGNHDCCVEKTWHDQSDQQVVNNTMNY